MYVNVVDRVRDAFKTKEVVRLDCAHVGTSDCKRIGVKLRVWLLWRVIYLSYMKFVCLKLVDPYV